MPLALPLINATLFAEPVIEPVFIDTVYQMWHTSSMLEIFLLLLPLFGMIGAGYVAGVTKVAKSDWVKVLNLFGYYLAFPALIFTSIASSTISWDLHGKTVLTQIGIGVGLIALTYFVSKALGASRENRNTFTIGVYFSNSGYIGLPALAIVFGETAASEGAVIVATMILITFTLGVGILEASRNKGVDIKKLILGIAKNPLIWAALFGLLVSVGNIPLFETVQRFIDFMAAAASPAVLVALGIFLAYNHPKAQTIKLASLLSGIKMLLIPAIFTLILILAPNQGDWLDVTYIQAAMPLAITTFAFAEIYPMNKNVVSTSILLSTLSAIFILPFIMWLTTQL